jgi:hypothetical protein
MNNTGGKSKKGQMQQVDLAAAQHLLSLLMTLFKPLLWGEIAL